MLITTVTHPRFPLGQIVATPAVLAAVPAEALAEGLARHGQGDWGNVCPEDARSNDEALTQGSRLLSVYGDGPQRFWIITEWDRSVTTLLLPEDY